MFAGYMKNSFFLAALLVLPFFVRAQDCRLDVDETDAFTKEHVRSGTNSIGGALWHWNLTLKQTGTKYGWEMQIKYSKNFQDEIKEGDVIFVSLENGKVVKLAADANYAPSQQVGSGFVTTVYHPKGNLTTSDLKDLSESPMSGIRVVLSGEKIEPAVSSKQGRHIQEIATCLLKN